MFTTSKRASEEELNRRVLLSIASWHAHVNICLPRRDQRPSADWTRFGPRGSISTEQQCEAANGRWIPQMFGWMVHIYPFERDFDQIFTHRMALPEMRAH